MKLYPYKLLYRPESELSKYYDILAEEPSLDGMRFLRGNNLSRVYESGGINNRVPKFTSMLKNLCRKNYVMAYDPIYVVVNREKTEIDWNDVIDKAEKYWNKFEFMRGLVESAPLY